MKTVLAKSTKMCYTYDNLNRVTSKTVKNISDDSVVSTETFTYDAAGNITDAPDSCFQYDTNNRLIVFNGNSVSYDMDGNMLSNSSLTCTYDSANRLITAGGHTYTYNAENVRIRNLCSDADTTYTYDTNCKLSKLLCKTTNGITTKYVYGRGLIGEEKQDCFKTYHFDYRGSTVAITDINGNVTDTFEYDTYGKLISRTGTSFVIFGYNGRDGVVTDKNGLVYMRARYYSPDMRRFINADIIAGSISNAVTLNRYAYANGNPVSYVDPFGLWGLKSVWNKFRNWVEEKVVSPVINTYNETKDFFVDTYNEAKEVVVDTYNDAKDTIVNSYNDVKVWATKTANEIVDKTSRAIDNTKNEVKEVSTKARKLIDYGINAAKAIYKISKDMRDIVINNIDASAGICIGVGVSTEVSGLGVEAISRMDIVGIQLKDGDFRIGHPGKSALGVSIPISPYADITVGPQNNTYEDFSTNYREVDDTSYFDVGKSYGVAAAFAIGYHCEVSISYSGIITDLIEYFR